MYPRSGFRSWGTCERTLVPVFVPGEHPNAHSFGFFVPGGHPPKPPFGKTTLLALPDYCELILYVSSYIMVMQCLFTPCQVWLAFT